MPSCLGDHGRAGGISQSQTSEASQSVRNRNPCYIESSPVPSRRIREKDCDAVINKETP